MIFVILLISFVTIILVYFYLTIKSNNNFWKEKNVKTGKSTPIIGDGLQMILGRENVVDLIKKMYNKLSNVRYLGVMQFGMPTLIVKCPELLKKICVKDFDHFLNHRNFIQGNDEELWSKNLLILKGQTWKQMRSTLSPSFTSSKMKAMFVLICNNANLFAQHFLNEEKKEGIIEIEFKDACTRYTNDIIASTAFGIEVDSLNDRNNEFYLMGKEAMNFSSTRKKIVFLLYQFLPSIASLLNIRVFGEKVERFFMNLVKDTIKLREEQNIKRPDMLGLLLEARNEKGLLINPPNKNKDENKIEEASFAAVEEHLKVLDDNSKRELTDSDIASQVFIFFLGGFETVSTAMCFMAHELASNPDCQKKLIEEIDRNRITNNGPIAYETIAKMTYLDMVVSETLRKWPVNIATDRVVTKPYTIDPELPDEQPVHLDVGMNIMIPIIAIHYDPKYYENPEKFDPERFSSENRKSIDPYTYIPFGIGPRNCIGSRFALLEMKALFFYLLSHFEIVPIKNTQIPIHLSKKAITLTPDNGFPLGLKKRHF